MALFDLACGNIFYDILPEDTYVLGTMERLNKKEYLYRILKEEGFDRVIFYNVEGIKVNIVAYDKLSAYSYENSKEFEKVSNWRNEADLNSFYASVDQKNVKPTRADLFSGSSKPSESGNKENKEEIPYEKEIGWKERIVYSIKKDNKQYVAEFTSHIESSLENTSIKTAIVFDYNMFRNIALDVNDFMLRFKSQHNCNIVVFSFPDENVLNNFSRDSFFRELIPCSQGKPAMEVLDSENILIKISDRIERDEIANDLYYRKNILKDKRFENLAFSKIYSLADFLGKCIETNSENRYITTERMYKVITYMNMIDTRYRNDAFVEEIVKKSETMKSNSLEYIADADIYVNRVAEKSRIFFINQEDIESILKEFDELKDIDDIKESLLSQIDYFEEQKELCKKKIDQGKEIKDDDLPYMNMQFLGAPGTGKTTVASLIAKYMCAKGILRTNKMSVVNCTDFMKTYANERKNVELLYCSCGDG